MQLSTVRRRLVATTLTAALTAALMLVPGAAFALMPQPTLSYGATGGEPQAGSICASYDSGVIHTTGFRADGWTITYASNVMPAGLRFETATGQIIGTPTSDPTYGTSNPLRFRVEATNSKKDAVSESAYRDFTLELDMPTPIISDLALPAATVGTAYSTQVEATNTCGTVFTASGLPQGLTISPSGLISGTPVFDSAAAATTPLTVTIQATNGNGTHHESVGEANTSQAVALTVLTPEPVITTDTIANGVRNVAYTGAITASVPTGSTPTFALVESALPAGLTLHADGTITGTPTTVTNGARFYVEVTSGTQTAYKMFSMAITEMVAPSIVTTVLDFGTTADAFSRTITATGGGVTFTLAGTLPAGVTFSNGVFSGVPTEEGAFTVTVTATNEVDSDKRTYEFDVYSAPSITTTELAPANQSVTYNASIAATGYKVAYSSSALPEGLMLNAQTGAITGKTAKEGTFPIVFTATNRAGATSRTLDLAVVTPEQALSESSASGNESVTVSGNGFEPNEPGEIYLNSVRTLIGSFTAQANGSFTVRVTIPAGTPAGVHRIESVGSISGIHQFTTITILATTTTTTTTTQPVQAVAPATTKTTALAATGANVAAPVGLSALLLMLGAAALIATRRRSTATQ